MVSENVFDYEQVNPVQTPTVDTTTGTDASSVTPVTTSGTTTPIMSEQEALQYIKPTINFADVAQMQKEKEEAQAKATGTTNGSEAPPIRQSMGERVSDPTYKKYDSAIKTVADKDEFSYGGNSYYKQDGKTYLRHDDLPGGSVEVHPDIAAKIEAAKIEGAARDYSRQEYLRKRQEWHDTPDTPNAGIEIEYSPRSHDPDNGVEREKRIFGDNGRLISSLVPAVASFATGAYGIQLPVKLATYGVSSVLNSTINSLANTSPHGSHPFSNLQPHIDN